MRIVKTDGRPQIMPTPQCYAKFELANGEFVSRCHLDLGHVGPHEGWCLGSKTLWPQGFTSEQELVESLGFEIWNNTFGPNSKDSKAEQSEL